MIYSEVEGKRLDTIASYFSMKDGFNGYMNKYRVSIILEKCKGQTVLDIGSADAFMAEALSPFFRRIVAVDGSAELINRAKQRLGDNTNVELINKLAEEYSTDERFDIVLLSFILEHVSDPADVLKRAAIFLNEKGTLFIMVPNAHSLHRRVGVALGMLKSVDDFSEEDIRQGHRRVYTLDSLKYDIAQSGLKLEESGTFFVKPLSNSQMELLDTKIADAFFEISKDLQGLGSMIYAKCRVN